MKILVYAGVLFLYGLLFHLFMRACQVVLGPFALDPALPIQWRGISYVAISASLAAAISTAAWFWKHRSLRLGAALVIGGLSVALILVNTGWSRGTEGLVALLTVRPLHTFTTLLLTFSAIPLCFYLTKLALRGTDASSERRG